MTIAACVLARNSAQTIERFIASVRPHVDEVCVWLGGESTDGTPAILERLASEPGCPILVEQGEWVDYAHARNANFAMASSDYVGWFDDDEVVEGGQWLKPLLAEDPVDALSVQRIEVWREMERPFIHFPEKFVRAEFFRDGTAYWTSPVHEWMVGIPGAARRSIASPAHIRVIHHPLEQSNRHKHRRLVEESYAADPGVHLGIVLARHLVVEDQDYAAAAALLEELVEADFPPEQFLDIAGCFELLAICRKELGDEAASAAAEKQWQDLTNCSLALGAKGMHPHALGIQRTAIEVTFPLRSDDPLWDTYWNDPRTASAKGIR